MCTEYAENELSLELSDGKPHNCYAQYYHSKVLADHPVLLSDMINYSGFIFLKAHNRQKDVSWPEFNILCERIRWSDLGEKIYSRCR